MENTLSLNAIFNQENCAFLIFDLSRRVTEISATDFIAIEENRVAYPYPAQLHAQMGIVFWQPDQTPWIWFLKIPLDERGLLNQAAMGDFIQFVAQAMGTRLEKTLNEEETQIANPYTFTPQDDKKSMFHAFLTARLQQPTSQYYDHAQHYISGELGWDEWQEVGLQGIADLCARMDCHNNISHIQNALNHMPETPLYALLGCLEHCSLPPSLANTLSQQMDEMLASNDIDLFLLAAHIRAMSGEKPIQLQLTIERILTSSALRHKEIFIAIAGRCWFVLEDNNLLDTFFVAVAEQQDHMFFQQMISDLVMIPTLRPKILSLLYGNASIDLIDAIKKLINQ